MRLYYLTIFMFLLTALAIGSTMQEAGQDFTLIDKSLDGVVGNITNLSLSPGDDVKADIPNIEGIYSVIEKYVHFVGVLLIETTRTGIKFGYENNEYFTPQFILAVLKFIIIAVIVGLLIKPLFYILILLTMFVMWIYDRFKRRYK